MGYNGFIEITLGDDEVGATVLRGRITPDGKIELLDDLPEDLDDVQAVSIVLHRLPTVYETVNEYGDRVIVDEKEGTVTPVEPFTMGDLLNSPLVGMWKDRREETGDPVEWLKKMRREEEERNDPWQGRTLSWPSDIPPYLRLLSRLIARS
jgi:hypothetical protein